MTIGVVLDSKIIDLTGKSTTVTLLNQYISNYVLNIYLYIHSFTNQGTISLKYAEIITEEQPIKM